MKISNIVIILLTLVLIQTNAHISIQIDPDDFDHVTEFFENIIINQQQPVVYRRFSVVLVLKKVTVSIIQMIGIMLTLVGANLITEKFHEVQAQPKQNDLVVRNNTINDLIEMCNEKDFGCNRNVCWRTCVDDSEKENNSQTWCYTSPKPEKREYHPCVYSYDCSPCWECIAGTCNK